jgi:hypothetical protein
METPGLNIKIVIPSGYKDMKYIESHQCRPETGRNKKPRYSRGFFIALSGAAQ